MTGQEDGDQVQDKPSVSSVLDSFDKANLAGQSQVGQTLDKYDDFDSRTSPAINYAVQQGADIDGDRAKRILNVQRRLSSKMPVDLIDRNLDYYEQETSKKDFKGDLFFNQDEKLKDWVTANAPRAALVRSDPQEMRRLGLMKMLIERPPALWPLSDSTIDADAHRIAKLRAEKDWKNGGLPTDLANRIQQAASAEAGIVEEPFTSQQAMEDEYYRQELDKRHHIEGIIRGSDEIGPIEAMTLRHPTDTLGRTIFGLFPFLAHAPEIEDKGELMAAAQAMKNGTADDIQKDLVQNAVRLEAVAQLRGKSMGAHFAETLAGFPAMAGEMAVGGGLAASGAKGLLGKGASKAVEALVESAIAAGTAGVPSAIETYQNLNTPKRSLGEDAEGNVIVNFNKEDGTPGAWAIPKAALSSFADYFGAKLFGPWFSKASPVEQMLAKKSLLAAFPLEGLKMVGMNDASALIKGLGGVEKLQAPSIVRAFSDPEVMKDVLSQIIVGGGSGVLHAAANNKQVSAFRAQLGSEGLAILGKIAAESKVMTDTPKEGSDFVKQFAQDGAHSHVYAPIGIWDKYWTSKGIAPREVARAVMGDTAAYDEATRLKGQLAIPMEDYLQHFGMQEHGDIFSKEFKLDPELPSHNQAQEQVKAAQEGQPLMPEEYLNAAGKRYSDMWNLGLKGDKAEEMQKALDDAMGPGLEKLKAEEIERRQKAQDKELDQLRKDVRPKVEEMVNSRPEQKAIERLRADDNLKLDRQKTAEMYGGQYGDVDVSQFPRGVFGEDGVHPDAVAEALGYGSGRELVEALQGLKGFDKKANVSSEVEKILQETRPDLYQTPKLSDADVEQIKGENHSKLLKAQWETLLSEDYAKARGLIKAVQRKPLSIDAVRTRAKLEIGAKTVRDTNPLKYKADMETARKEAENAILSGDVETAADAKERELDNYEHYRAALEAKQRNAALINWARRTQSQEFRAKLGKADKDYLQQFDAIAGQFELAKVPDAVLQSRKALKDFIAEKEANGESLAENVAAPEWLLNEANKINYKDLTNDQFRDVMEVVTQLDKMATEKNKLIAGEKKVEWQDAEGKLVDEIRKNKPLDVEPTRSAMTWVDKLKKFGRKIDASLIKGEQFLKEMTNGNIASEWMNRFWHPLADAQAREYDYTERVTSKLAEAVSEMPKEIRERMRDVVQMPGARRMTRLDLIGIALNAGNDSNLSKMVRGEMQRKGGLTEMQLHEALNMLTAPEIDYVNKIHRILEGMYPDINALHQELTGLPLEKVQPRAMQLENGRIDGGYYPLIYDAGAASDPRAAKANEARVGDMMTDGYSRATLGWGHRKGRIEGFAAPIDFDVQNLPSHIASVIKDITHRKWVIDANKIMQSKAIRGALTETYGEEMTNRLTELVKEAVNDRNQPSLESLSGWRRIISGFRTNTAIVATGFKIATLLEHTFSIGAAVDEIGADYFRQGLGKTLQSPGDAFREATEKSGEMRHFLENGNRDIRDKLRELEGQNGHIADIQRTAAHAIGFANLSRALPVWWGAYYKALEALPESHGFEGEELEKYAVRSADQTLRLTIGTAGAKDLSAVQSGARGGDLMKLFTMFYTPGSVLYSRLHDIGHEAGQTKDIPRALVRTFFVVPFAATLQALVRGEFPRQDKDESWAGWWLKNNATYPFSSVPIVRDLANTVAYGRESSIDTPGTATVKSILDTYDLSERAFRGEMSAREPVEKAIHGLMQLYGVPAEQAWSMGNYIVDLHNGEAHSNNIFELYRNLLHYKHKPPK